MVEQKATWLTIVGIFSSGNCNEVNVVMLEYFNQATKKRQLVSREGDWYLYITFSLLAAGFHWGGRV